jgi:hypothetical protein
MISKNFLSSLPNIALAATFLITWIAPFTFGEKMISDLVIIMIMEFIIIHSSVFMGIIMISTLPKQKKALFLTGIGLFYSLFVAGFSFGFGVWWPFIAFWTLMANKLSAIFLGTVPSEEQKALIGTSWVLGVVCYLGGVMVTAVIPLPALGITAEVIAAQEFEGSGSWIDEPQTALAFGFLYFSAVAFTEYKAKQWLKIPGELFSGLDIGSRVTKMFGGKDGKGQDPA